MKKQYRLPLQALLVAIGLLIGMSAALYAADENQAQTEPDLAVEPGLVIVAVDQDGPAAAAGVARGDILLAVDDTEVNTVEELMVALAEVEAGATVTLHLQHGDEVQEIEVETANGDQGAYLGIQPYVSPDLLMAAPPVFQRRLERPGFAFPPTPFAEANVKRQLVIVDVLAGSAAEDAGLQARDVITAVNGEAVTEPPALKADLAALEPGDVITLTIVRAEEEPFDIAVTLGEGEEGQAQLGVKLGMIATVDAMMGGMMEGGMMESVPATPGQRFEWMPAPAQKARPFHFWHYGPGPRERHFFRFQRPVQPPMYFFALPHPGFAPQQDFLYYEEGMRMPDPTQPDQSLMHPPFSQEFQGELQQAPPLEQESTPYY